MDILFVDANVLFSAAYRDAAGIARLWDLDDVELVTSHYAADEARRNLPEPHQQVRLENLLRRTRIEAGVIALGIPDDIALPKKDRPILAAAVSVRATHLITGDVTHFGALFGRDVAGVRIVPAARYLRERRIRQEGSASHTPGPR